MKMLLLRTALAAFLLTATTLPAPALAQCGSSVTGRFGGETGAVAQLNATTLAIGRGSTIELLNASNPNAPVSFSPRRIMPLNAPARKIAFTPGSPRLFVLMEDGDVCIGTISTSPFMSVGFPVTIGSNYGVDILADGQKVYIARLDETDDRAYSEVYIYDDTTGTPTFVRRIDPFIDNYGFDRLAKIGNILWIGMHEHDSTIFGIEGYDVTTPASPVRVTTSLANVPFGSPTEVTAMQAIGNKLLVSFYRHPTGGENEDWMRGVDVSVPASPSWRQQVDLSGHCGGMAWAGGNLLRISILGQGIGTWDTTNLDALTWQGAYFDTFPLVGQMLSGMGGGVTDYWAAGRGGLMTMNTANPASVSVRSDLDALPIGPSVVRQSGNTTVMLDYTLNTLRLYDYTLAEASQHRSSIFLPLYAEYVELGSLAGGAVTLACVATDAPTNDSITIYDITNPAAPTTRATITGVSAKLMAVTGSRLYVFTYSRELRVYELSQQPPQLRSTTPFGGSYSDYTCLTSWETAGGATKAVALGTDPYGLWVINTTDATAPLVSSIWNPLPNYRVHAVTKGANYLYVSARIEGEFFGSIADTRLEALNVTNLANVTQRFVADSTHGCGYPGIFEGLTYISSPTGKFLIGTHDEGWEGELSNRVEVFELPPGFLTNEAVPFRLESYTLPHATGAAAKNADGTRFILAGGPAGLYQLSTPVQWEPGFGIENFSKSACYDGTVTFTAFPSSNPVVSGVQWFRFGQTTPGGSYVTTTLVNGPTGHGSTISGATETSLTISNLRPIDADAYYYMGATNTCDTHYSASAYIDLCPSDFNCSGSTTVQDVFDFLTAYFAGDPKADFNGSGSVSIQDIFDYLTAYFRVCF